MCLFVGPEEEQGTSWQPKKGGGALMDEGSVFTRLEETRAELESKLGMDVFMEAYSECQVSYDTTGTVGSSMALYLVVAR